MPSRNEISLTFSLILTDDWSLDATCHSAPGHHLAVRGFELARKHHMQEGHKIGVKTSNADLSTMQKATKGLHGAHLLYAEHRHASHGGGSRIVEGATVEVAYAHSIEPSHAVFDPCKTDGSGRPVRDYPFRARHPGAGTPNGAFEMDLRAAWCGRVFLNIPAWCGRISEHPDDVPAALESGPTQVKIPRGYMRFPTRAWHEGQYVIGVVKKFDRKTELYTIESPPPRRNLPSHGRRCDCSPTDYPRRGRGAATPPPRNSHRYKSGPYKQTEGPHLNLGPPVKNLPDATIIEGCHREHLCVEESVNQSDNFPFLMILISIVQVACFASLLPRGIIPRPGSRRRRGAASILWRRVAATRRFNSRLGARDSGTGRPNSWRATRRLPPRRPSRAPTTSGSRRCGIGRTATTAGRSGP